MNVRPAGREACNCASPYNSILERLDAMEAEILTAMQEANTAVGIANAALRQVQAAGIRTVNQIQPDADGEFSITAGTGIQINAGTNGIEIENISEGAVYTGVSPIEVNADNEISLEGWTAHSLAANWDEVVVGGVSIKEIMIGPANENLTTSGQAGGMIYIPKGTSMTNFKCGLFFNWENTTIVHLFFKASALVGTGSFVSPVARRTLDVTATGSGINQVINLEIVKENSSSLTKSSLRMWIR